MPFDSKELNIQILIIVFRRALEALYEIVAKYRLYETWAESLADSMGRTEEFAVLRQLPR
jgi:hypothetical protein